MAKKVNLSKSPTDCPYCGGEREWDGVGNNAVCHFCGRTAKAENKKKGA